VNVLHIYRFCYVSISLLNLYSLSSRQCWTQIGAHVCVALIMSFYLIKALFVLLIIDTGCVLFSVFLESNVQFQLVMFLWLPVLLLFCILMSYYLKMFRIFLCAFVTYIKLILCCVMLCLWCSLRCTKARFPLPEFTARVHGPSWRPVNSGTFFDTRVDGPSWRVSNTGRQLGPWTLVVETGLKNALTTVKCDKGSQMRIKAYRLLSMFGKEKVVKKLINNQVN